MMITQEQFNKAMGDAIEARKKAKWTHEQRVNFYVRIEANILKECEEEGILSDSNKLESKPDKA